MNSTTKTREPVLVSMSILAALQILFGGIGGVTYLADNELIAAICAVGMVAVGAAQVGVQFYVRGQVVPLESVVERLADDGSVVAGPANDRELENAYVRNIGVDEAAVVVDDVSRLDELDGVGRGEGGSAL